MHHVCTPSIGQAMHQVRTPSVGRAMHPYRPGHAPGVHPRNRPGGQRQAGSCWRTSNVGLLSSLARHQTVCRSMPASLQMRALRHPCMLPNRAALAPAGSCAAKPGCCPACRTARTNLQAYRDPVGRAAPCASYSNSTQSTHSCAPSAHPHTTPAACVT